MLPIQSMIKCGRHISGRLCGASLHSVEHWGTQGGDEVSNCLQSKRKPEDLDVSTVQQRESVLRCGKECHLWVDGKNCMMGLCETNQTPIVLICKKLNHPTSYHKVSLLTFNNIELSIISHDLHLQKEFFHLLWNGTCSNFTFVLNT